MLIPDAMELVKAIKENSKNETLLEYANEIETQVNKEVGDEDTTL